MTPRSVKGFLRGILLTLAAMVAATGCAPSLVNTATGRVNGRTVEYALVERGTVPVVFENGLGATMDHWRKVQDGLGDVTTFAHNRPGYGESAPSLDARGGPEIVGELRKLLAAKGLKPPYVLVGHSMGGLYMQYFARSRPEEVAALVLVDSTHPRQFQGKSSPDLWPLWFKVGWKFVMTPTARREFDEADRTGEEILKLPTYTRGPVIILSALEPMKAKSELADAANAKRKELALLYPGSKQIWVESGHDIPGEKPGAVIDAVREALRGVAR